MKFDFCIGNPPYQEDTIGDNKNFAPPVYHHFYNAACKIAKKVELITPARFLFNAGATPKAWNEKMLHDEHFKVLEYKADSTQVFKNADIKGGVAVTYYDEEKSFGAIDVFIPFEELKSIKIKVENHDIFESISKIVLSAYSYHFSEELYKDYPNLRTKLSKGHEYDLKSNVFEKLSEVFLETPLNHNESYAKIIGLFKGKRVFRYILRKYLKTPNNFEKYKVFMPGANGSGAIGEVLSTPLIGESLIGEPLIGGTETFISIGLFNTYNESDALLKYVKSKFARVLLGVLKVTQNITPEKWKYVPLQDFTAQSDIDWSKSIPEIDQQLYKKYGLSQEEIDFIETHVKEMV